MGLSSFRIPDTLEWYNRAHGNAFLVFGCAARAEAQVDVANEVRRAKHSREICDGHPLVGREGPEELM